MLTRESEPETYNLIGALLEVHRELGPGYLERTYGHALERELRLRGIPYEREVSFRIPFKGEYLPGFHRMDFVCHGRIVVETKAQDVLARRDAAQIIHYLKATGHPIGILANFGEASLVWRRYVNRLGPGTAPAEVREIREIPAPEGRHGHSPPCQGSAPTT